MNENFNLIISTGHATFQATLQQVDRHSDSTITIEGKHYRLIGDDKNYNFAKLAKHIKEFSWIKFESMNDFKRRALAQTKFTIVGSQAVPSVNKLSTEIIKGQSRKIEQTLSVNVKDRAELQAARLQAEKALLANKPATEVSHALCENMKNLMARMYNEAATSLREQGLEPPCQFCVVGLGSIARDEAGPYPDFDNIIVVERKSPEVESYFLRLNQHVADRVYRLGESLEGNKPGLRFCWGNLNPQYQPYESRYSATPTYRGRADLLVTPTKDPTTVRLGDVKDGVPFYGTNLSLYSTYKSMSFPPAATLLQVRADMQRQVSALRPGDPNPPSPITASELPALVHIKEDLCRLPAACIGALALYHGITAPTTIGRIEALKALGHLDKGLADRLITTMEILVKWRIQVQSAHSEEFEFVATSAEALVAFERELPQRISLLDAKIATLEAAKPRDEIAIGNAKGQREFALDCQKGIVGTVKSKPHAFTEADRAALRTVVLPTLRDLYKRATLCLPDSQAIDPSVFR